MEPMTADTHQHGVPLTSDGTLLVVGTGPVDGSDEGPSLTIRAPGGHDRVVPLGAPHEDGGTAYVGGGFTREGSWDGVTVVDLNSGEP